MKGTWRSTFPHPRLSIASAIAVSLSVVSLARALDRFVSLNGTHQPPFTSWDSAATNIQAAIDAASAGDIIHVTNGVYATGGKAVTGGMTNRIAVDKAITVLSENGPQVTIIQGQWDPATNGPGAVRCAWLGSGAVLNGFTLRGGATRSAGDNATLQSGGGLWCASTTAMAQNCFLTMNAAAYSGGGVYSGTLSNCVILANQAPPLLANGGGAANSTLIVCPLIANSARKSGGGAFNCALTNCTVTGNHAGEDGGGAVRGTLRNCIIWGNTARTLPNCELASLTYSCTTPLPSGPGNITLDPQLLPDGIHVSSNSPCRGAGLALPTGGSDIDGQMWAAVPSMGCDEWHPEPAISIAPAWSVPLDGPGAAVNWTFAAGGEPPLAYAWTKDGAAIAEGPHYSGIQGPVLLVRGLSPDDAGSYQVWVSNSLGTAISPPARLVIHCADAGAIAPAAPYTTWQTAADSIQAAVEAMQPGEILLVTNGVYATGGRPVEDFLTNRVVLKQAAAVMSVNGPDATIIQGQWDPATTNGPGAVRCAWLGVGAVLDGFTLSGGATLAKYGAPSGAGAGVFDSDTNALIVNCVLTRNVGYDPGGGAYGGTFYNCSFSNNFARNGSGGGACAANLSHCVLSGNSAAMGGAFAGESQTLPFGTVLENCTVISNSANFGGGINIGIANNCVIIGNHGSRGGGGQQCQFNNCFISANTADLGGGVHFGILNHCTLTGNSASLIGGGAYHGVFTNCILWANHAPSGPNWSGSSLAFSCTSPLAAGTGNIDSDPQLTDGEHLAVTSPCKGAGTPDFTSGTDIDGEPWAQPPSMGCDEVWGVPAGPLAVQVTSAWNEIPAGVPLDLTAILSGRASRLEWDLGDGVSVTNAGWLVPHAWPVPGDYTVTVRAFNTDNPNGVSADKVIRVVPLQIPTVMASLPATNRFQLSFISQPGVNWQVEYTTNLAQPVWQMLQTISSTGGLSTVQFTNQPAPECFYRLHSR